MAQTVYNEAVEARVFVRGATHYHTEDEQAVFDAVQANAIRLKARFGLKVAGQRELWEKELAAVDGALPMNDPRVVAALADGKTEFYHRVWDRIWREHQSEISVPRCPECKCILKTWLAQQCLWCGYNWHKEH